MVTHCSSDVGHCVSNAHLFKVQGKAFKKEKGMPSFGIEKESCGGLKALGYDFREGDDRLVAQPNHYTTE